MAYSTKAITQKSQKAQKLQKPGLVTYEQYFERAGETEKVELLDGKIIRDSPGIPRHALIISWLNRLIGYFAEKFELGEVFVSPTSVRLTKYQAPEPDVFFIRKNRLGILGERYVDGPPDLCVEVISRSSRKIDRERKFVLYADHGVREYWLIDPFENTLEFYENIAGEFIAIEPDAQSRLSSKVLPGFWLKAAWIQGEMPKPVLEALQEILGKKTH